MKEKTWQPISSSQMAKKTFNPIRNILETMDLKPNPKKKMISLSIGDPTVFGNLKPSPVAIEAVKEVLEGGNHNGYASSTGYPEARQAVAQHLNCHGLAYHEDDIVLCSGCSSALDLCISVIANPGDNILVPKPGFPLYKTLATGIGVSVKEYQLIPEKDWEADIQDLESLIDAGTKAIVVTNPSNPCGSVYSKEHLLEILAVAERNTLPIIMDEIYEFFFFDLPGLDFLPLASLTKRVPILTCGGLTKRYLVPGWRLGWIAVHDPQGIFAEVKNGLKSLSQRIMGANTLVQGALPTILKNTPNDFFDSTIATIQSNAELAFQRLSLIPGLRPIKPRGAMYMMVGIERELFPDFNNDLEIVQAMIQEQSVFCLPGKCFNIQDFVRIVLTVPERLMEEACDRIEEFCRMHVRSEHQEEKAVEEGVEVTDTRKISDSSSGHSSGMSSGDEAEQQQRCSFPAANFLRRKYKKSAAPFLRRDTISRLV